MAFPVGLKTTERFPGGLGRIRSICPARWEKRGNMMIASLWKAPAAMIQHAGLYITIWVLGLVSALLVIIGEAGLLEWFGGGFLLNPNQPIDLTNFAMGGIVFLFSIAITFFLYGLLTRQLEKKQNVSVGFIAGQSILLGLLITIVGSALIVKLRILMTFVAGGGILSIAALILIFLIGVLSVVALIKFCFTPILTGYGLPIKDALAESWKQTSGHFWVLFILFLLVNVISSLIQSLEVFIPVTGNEWIDVGIVVTLGAIATFYSITVFVLALPNKEGIHSLLPRRHGRMK